MRWPPQVSQARYDAMLSDCRRDIYGPDALERLIEAQEHLCGLCAKEIAKNWRQTGGALRASIDHVIPRSRRGPDRLGNWLASHVRCNSRKADRMPTGCELIWLLAVNARLGVKPVGW